METPQTPQGYNNQGGTTQILTLTTGYGSKDAHRRAHTLAETEEEQNTVNSANVLADEDELLSWENFCTIESTGVDEFFGPKAEERLRTDEAVWKMLEETIVSKEDGYWVRLPWRKDAQQLPDKGLAPEALVKRLVDEPELLQGTKKRCKISLLKES
ncbi:hypothetical protein GCK32_017225 [Trichostrongylus colubriformis]|uniref:Uncharacterized protein n=1 Tax=Trichostrongylus colubriformis TaxID=6319 RepID=A0AAN8G5M0_TRICO